jgi:hypothetical protein
MFRNTLEWALIGWSAANVAIRLLVASAGRCRDRSCSRWREGNEERDDGHAQIVLHQAQLNRCGAYLTHGVARELTAVDCDIPE